MQISHDARSDFLPRQCSVLSGPRISISVQLQLREALNVLKHLFPIYHNLHEKKSGVCEHKDLLHGFLDSV